MTTLADVLAWQPETLTGIADQLNAERRALLGLEPDLDAGRPPTAWVAPAQQQATRAHRSLELTLADAVSELAAVFQAVDDAAADLTALRRELDSVIDWCGPHGFAVNRSTGVITDLHPVIGDDDAQADRDLTRTELSERIAQAVQAADHIDTQLADLLRRALSGSLHVAGTDLSDADATGSAAGQLAVTPPPTDGSAYESSAWWRSLSPEDQQWVLDNHPEWLGNTDGIPAGIRDQANRVLLDREQERLQSEIDDLQAQMDATLDPTEHEYLRLQIVAAQEKLDGMAVIEQILASSEDRYLLVLDASGPVLKAAVAVGDVDAADHVSVFTPGMGTTVAGSLGSYDENMQNLKILTQKMLNDLGAGETAACIAWFGYETPDVSNVAGTGLAKRGGADLADFLQGINASRSDDPHLTALGHSYGSTTTGYALQEPTGTDSAVIFGSPGIATDNLADVQVPSDSIYRIEARNDPVADFGRFGVDPTLLPMTGLTSSEATLPDGTVLTESTGHSDYLTNGSTSQYNLAAIGAGQPDLAFMGDNIGFGDYFMGGLWAGIELWGGR
ncbi:alpha/beta hydrolase [Cellulomonas sp. NPDC089187]|uniref:alpha/beta hydrolase n=1 Tax=Cellulomonas sp. NPDC089187 TaxID=3154970 RepID=UPI0034152DAA